MKKIGIILTVLLGTLFWSKIIMADTAASALGPDIIGLDADRNGLVSLATIQEGQDTFLVRDAAPNEVQKITTSDGKGYNPVTIEELLKLADSQQHVLTSSAINGLKLHIYTARYLEGTNKIIVERDISNNIQAIKLIPNKTNTYTTVITIADAEGNNIMTKVIPINVANNNSNNKTN